MSDMPIEDFADDSIFQVNKGEMNPTVTYVTTDGAEEDLGAELAARAFEIGTTTDGRPIRDEIASAIGNWSSRLSSSAGGSMFFRNRYELSTNPYDQMLQVQDACEHDEIISSILDSTEGMTFNRLTLDCVDADQQDVWAQMCEKMKLGNAIRSVWRELFKVSQCYLGVWWEEQTFTVRTKITAVDGMNDDISELDTAAAKKRKRRKQFAGLVPTELTVFDPTKIMPVGTLLFGRQRYAYIANKAEHDAFLEAFDGARSDLTVLKMLEGPYTPSADEAALISKDRSGGNSKYMWLFRPESLVRFCLTKSDFERFSPIRLKSILPLLDMKTHLRAADRAHLIGATNFIIVLTRGSDKLPAKAGEIEQLRDQARTVARMPILIGDHRLNVEIITPKMDWTLNRDRYDTIDERIIMRALGTFRTGGNPAGRSETAGEIGAIVMRNIESRRNKIAEDIEDTLFQMVLDRNASNTRPFLTEIPDIVFHPRRVTLTTDINVVNGILQLRDRGEISRETILEEFDYDQEVEYLRRKREKSMDDVFQTAVPYSSPDSNPFTDGQKGGRPKGQVDAPKQASPKTPKAPNAANTPGGDM